MDPFVELALRPGVQRRKAADDARLALGDDQLRVGHDEQRRADDRQSQVMEGSAAGSYRAVIFPVPVDEARNALVDGGARLEAMVALDRADVGEGVACTSPGCIG